MRTGIARARCVAAVMFAVLVVSRFGWAQTYQGGMRGVVKDAQGVVPGVEVTLVNEATNAVRTVTTNEVGEYSFPSGCAAVSGNGGWQEGAVAAAWKQVRAVHERAMAIGQSARRSTSESPAFSPGA